MSYSYSPAVEASLERMGELDLDPTDQIYARLFAACPDMAPLFWRDTNGAIKGEMLSRVFAAILDFVGERHYADHMIKTEMITHEGYDVPREIFATFFTAVGDTVREMLGQDWTADMDVAWRDMLADIEIFVGQTPRSDVVTPYRQIESPTSTASA